MWRNRAIALTALVFTAGWDPEVVLLQYLRWLGSLWKRNSIKLRDGEDIFSGHTAYILGWAFCHRQALDQQKDKTPTCVSVRWGGRRSGSWLLREPASCGGSGVALVGRKASFQEPAPVNTISCLDWIYGHHQSTRPHPTVEGTSIPWGVVMVYLPAALQRESQGFPGLAVTWDKPRTQPATLLGEC